MIRNAHRRTVRSKPTRSTPPRSTSPLPHPSWTVTLTGHSPRPAAIAPKDFWERLGI